MGSISWPGEDSVIWGSPCCPGSTDRLFHEYYQNILEKSHYCASSETVDTTKLLNSWSTWFPNGRIPWVEAKPGFFQ